MVLDPHQTPSPSHAAPKLLDRATKALRDLGLDQQAANAAVAVMRQFIFFQGKRHPQQMGIYEVEQFLTHLAVERQVAASTQKQALCALAFLDETVLGQELGQVMPVRGKHGRRIPVVLSRSEVPRVLKNVSGADGMFGLCAR